jgi:hypothetical protein
LFAEIVFQNKIKMKNNLQYPEILYRSGKLFLTLDHAMLAPPGQLPSSPPGEWM